MANAEKIPTWAVLIMMFGGFLSLLGAVFDPLHLIPDGQQAAQAAVIAGVLGSVILPSVLKRL